MCNSIRIVTERFGIEITLAATMKPTLNLSECRQVGDSPLPMCKKNFLTGLFFANEPY